MKNTMKSLLALLLLLLCAFACSCRQEVPDTYDMDEATAKTLLASQGLAVKCEYEYSDYVEKGNVIHTEPSCYSRVKKGTSITIYVSKGMAKYYLKHAVARIWDVEGIDPFSWGDNGEKQTKCFYTPYVEEEYLYIDMYLCCTSQYPLAFYKNFGEASITDTFDKTVPIEVIYKNKTVNNTGGKTEFTVKIPLNDLDVQKPTNLYIEFDFTVNQVRQTFKASFDLSW